MDYLINNNLKIKENKDFILEAKRINLKLKKLIKKPIFIKRKIEKTHILYIDDTHHEEKAFKVRGAYSEIINNFNRIKKKNNTIVLASTGNFAQAISNICIKKKINCGAYLYNSKTGETYFCELENCKQIMQPLEDSISDEVTGSKKSKKSKIPKFKKKKKSKIPKFKKKTE